MESSLGIDEALNREIYQNKPKLAQEQKKDDQQAMMNFF